MASSQSAVPASPPLTPTREPNDRKLGLNQVYPSLGNRKHTTNVTIVAIHGLGNQSPKTWFAWKVDDDPKSGQVHWLRDPEMLPNVFPDARIFTYDWDTNYDTGAQTDGFSGHADKLLERLHIRRSKIGDDQPIIFIASGFGGLVVCKALHRASTGHSNYKHILDETAGILFMGTPFRGSGQTFMDVVNMRLAVAETLGEKNEELIRYLKSDQSRDLDDIVREFTEMAQSDSRKLSIVCLYETRLTDFTESLKKLPESFHKVLDNNNKAILVPENSACLAGYPRSGLDVRHGMLNKFARPDDDAFETVCFYLRKLVKNAQSIVRRDKLHPAFSKIQQTLYVTNYLACMNRNPDPVKGTCEWFIGHGDFKKWQEAKVSSLLWVSANPGCGKSVLAKHLVRTLRTSSARTVCYFFFRENFDNQKKATTALSCVLHQIFEQRPELLSHEIVQRFESRNFDIVRSFEDLWGILMMACQYDKTGEIVCVLDALDECQNQEREKLIETLQQFYSTESTVEKTTKLKCLITSRPNGKIERTFEPLDASEVSIVHLKGESPEELSKIEHAINLYIAEKVSLLQKKLSLTEDEENILLERLQSFRNQTYIWVYLTLELIEKELLISKDRMDRVTSSLPSTVYEAYERILAKIEDNHEREAKKLLQIVVGATRPLTVDEMRFVMALRPYHTRYGDVQAAQITTERFPLYIRQLCGLFVNIIDSKIYLCHQTAKEFLVPSDMSEEDASERKKNKKSVWRGSLPPSECNLVIGHICLRYLLFSDFETDTLDAARYCFFEYSAAHWAEHFRASHSEDADVVDSVLRICDAGSLRCMNWFRVYWSHSSTMDIPKDFTSLMIASYFGIERAVKLLLRNDRKSDVAAQDSTYQRTAISWASQNGFDGVVKRLLKAVKMHPKNIATLSWYARAEVNSKDVSGRPALFYAVWNGHRVVVQTLLDAGAKADLKDNIGVTLLSYALAAGHKDIVKMLTKTATEESEEVTRHKLLLSAVENDDTVILKRLIEAGASTETQDDSRRTLLAIASRKGLIASAKLLLQSGANIEAQDIHGSTPLFAAARKENEAIIKLLLQAGANIEAQDINGSTPLFAAARKENEAIIKLLLQAGANIEAQDMNGWTPLLAAIWKENEAIIKLLLRAGANIEAQDMNGWTPLFAAVRREKEARIRLLLQAGADTEAQDENGRTPLFYAVASNKEAIIRLLLQAGANIEAQDIAWETPFFNAVVYGHEAAIKLLMEAGANIEKRDNDGSTPLLRAAMVSLNEAAVELLLRAGADIEAKNNDGSTPLLRAVTRQNEAMINLLLQFGANVEARDVSGLTPLLTVVTTSQNEAIIKLLLQAHANTEASDSHHTTALLHAVVQRNKAVIKLLLQAGADIEAKDGDGFTPLTWAARQGYNEIVTLLQQRRVISHKDTSDSSDESDVSDIPSLWSKASNSTSATDSKNLRTDPLNSSRVFDVDEEAANTLAHHLYLNADLHQIYVQAVQKFGTGRFAENHTRLLKIFITEHRLASSDPRLLQAIKSVGKKRSRILVTRHVIRLLDAEMAPPTEREETVGALLGQQPDRDRRLAPLLPTNTGPSKARTERLNPGGSRDNTQQANEKTAAEGREMIDEQQSSDDEDDDDEDDDEDDNNQEVKGTEPTEIEPFVDVVLSGPPFMGFKSNLSCIIHPPTTISEALERKNLRALRRLLRKHFNTVATGEYAWIQELDEIGYSRDEIAETLFEDSRDSPWIFCISEEEPIIKLDVHLSHHLSRCAHQFRWRQTDGSVYVNLDVSHSQDTSSILESVQQLCGVAGITPISRDTDTWNGSMTFQSENSIGFVSYAHQDISRMISRSINILELLCTALCQVQSAGLCCDSFTILRRDVNEGSPRSESVIDMYRIDFSFLVEMLKTMTHFASSRKVRSHDLEVASRLPKALCLEPQEHDFCEGSETLKFLHMCCLSIQTMALGFTLYLQAHIVPFHPFFLDTALQEIQLLGCEPQSGSYSMVEVRPENLTCVGDMLQGSVFVFNMRASVVSSPSISNSEPGRFDLLSTCEDLIDTWGPGQFVMPTPESTSPSAVCIGGGMIFLSDPDRKTFHWSRNASAKEFCRGEIDPAASIRVGVVTENANCHMDEAACRTQCDRLLKTLGTSNPRWEPHERQFGLQAGMHALAQANAVYKRSPGRTLKQEFLNDIDMKLKLLYFIEKHWAVQVSLCTGVARRVTLRQMIADLLPNFPDSLIWRDEYENWNLNKHDISSAFRNGDLSAWFHDPGNKSLQDLTIKITLSILDTLGKTGLDREAKSLLVSWPSLTEWEQCFAISLSRRESSWAELIADSTDCATFAYASPTCLETTDIRCSRSATPWKNEILVLETVVCHVDDGRQNRPMETTSKLRHDETYYFETFGRGQLFFKANKPSNTHDIKLLKRSALKDVPEKIRFRIRSRAQRLRERRAIHADGEPVFVLASPDG